jgi:hypothetical protein
MSEDLVLQSFIVSSSLQSTVYEAAHYALFLKAINNKRSVMWQFTVSNLISNVLVSFILFIVVLLLCCMKYLNGKLGYLAPTIFNWYYCCNYFYYYNTVNNNYKGNAICSLKKLVLTLAGLFSCHFSSSSSSSSSSGGGSDMTLNNIFFFLPQQVPFVLY